MPGNGSSSKSQWKTNRYWEDYKNNSLITRCNSGKTRRISESDYSRTYASTRMSLINPQCLPASNSRQPIKLVWIPSCNALRLIISVIHGFINPLIHSSSSLISSSNASQPTHRCRSTRNASQEHCPTPRQTTTIITANKTRTGKKCMHRIAKKCYSMALKTLATAITLSRYSQPMLWIWWSLLRIKTHTERMRISWSKLEAPTKSKLCCPENSATISN